MGASSWPSGPLGARPAQGPMAHGLRRARPGSLPTADIPGEGAIRLQGLCSLAGEATAQSQGWPGRGRSPCPDVTPVLPAGPLPTPGWWEPSPVHLPLRGHRGSLGLGGQHQGPAWVVWLLVVLCPLPPRWTALCSGSRSQGVLSCPPFLPPQRSYRKPSGAGSPAWPCPQRPDASVQPQGPETGCVFPTRAAGVRGASSE